jgi:hypothetical protein
VSLLSELTPAGAVEPPPILQEMKTHIEFRANLPVENVKRVASVLSEWKSGRYGIFPMASAACCETSRIIEI